MITRQEEEQPRTGSAQRPVSLVGLETASLPSWLLRNDFHFLHHAGIFMIQNMAVQHKLTSKC